MIPKLWRQRDAESRNDLKRHMEALDDLYDMYKEEVIDVIRNEATFERSSEIGLRVLAWSIGLRGLPQSGFPNIRIFLSLSAIFRAWKGNFDLLEDAIFVATGISARIIVPNHGDWFIVGEGEVGIDEIGLNFKQEPLDVWEIGEGEIGVHDIGSEEVNPQLPYEFYIDLPFSPTAEQRSILDWVVASFKRAIDKPIIRVPSTFECWIVGETTAATTELVERILFPDGSTGTDGTFAVDATSSEGSSIGIDTMICLPCFEVGVTPVGGGYICDDTTTNQALHFLAWFRGYTQRHQWF